MTGEDHVTEEFHVVEQRRPEPRLRFDVITAVAAVTAGLGGVVFAVALLGGLHRDVYGLALAVGLIALAIAVRRYFAGSYPHVEAVEPRERSAADADEPLAEVPPTAPSRLPRRLLIGAAGIFGISLAAPVASLGPRAGDALRHTRWAEGVRLVDTAGEPVRPGDLPAGSALRVWPEEAVEDERSATLLVRLSGRAAEPTNLDWVIDGNLVAYSKVCTHAGCPVGLFRERDDSLFCPCHQTTFDAARAARPTFGPAARNLPQLPMTVDDEGFLVALGDFTEQVGPSFGWLGTLPEERDG